MRQPPRSLFFLFFASLACIVFVILGLLPSTLYAQGTVSLRVQVIYAANEPGGVDTRLGSLAGDLKKTFPYSMYQLLDAPQGSAALNQTWKSGLPDNRSLEILLTAIQDGQYSLTVRVLGSDGKGLVNTAVRLRSGGPPILFGGWTHQKGVLIIAISAG